MYSMIGGATSTIGARGERRINHHREKSFMAKLGRPSRLLRKQMTIDSGESNVVVTPVIGSPQHLTTHSRTPSKTGSLEEGEAGNQWASKPTKYGDECCGGRISLLHFCVIFLMAGVIILIVGAVQFKLEAELYHYRHIIVTAGCATLGLGFALFFIKCTCFCRPQPNKSDLEDDEVEVNATKHQNGTKKEPATMSPVFHHETVEDDEDDVNHHDIVLIESGKNSVAMKEICKSDYDNSDKIIQAEVEICHSA